jgi:hypothetical protein
MNPLPEKVREGLTWRRFRNALRSPSLLWRNAPFWWNDDVSTSEHLFVLGPPRSGTTLLKNILQSHSEICGVDSETRFFLRSNYAGFRHPSIPDDEMNTLIRESQSPVDLFDRFAERMKEQSQANRFLEKTPEHALRLSYLLDHFPRSHFAFIVRDPRDGVRSARKHPVIWSTFPDKDRLGGYLEVWRRSVEAFLVHAGDDAVVQIRYEDLCRDPQTEVRALLQEIGIQFEDQQLDPEEYGKTKASTSETHSRLRAPITAKSVGRWKDTLTKTDILRIERTLADEMKALDYELTLK